MIQVPASPGNSPKDKPNLETSTTLKNPTQEPKQSFDYKTPRTFATADILRLISPKRNREGEKLSDASLSQGYPEESNKPSVDNSAKHCSEKKQRRRSIEYSPVHKVHVDDKQDNANQLDKKSSGKYRLSVANNATVRLSIDVVNNQTGGMPKHDKNLFHSTNSSQPNEINRNEIDFSRPSLTPDNKIVGLYQLTIQEETNMNPEHIQEKKKFSLPKAIDLHSRQKKIGTRITDFNTYGNDTDSGDSSRQSLTNREFEPHLKLHLKQQSSTEYRRSALTRNTVFTKDWASAGLMLTKSTIRAVPDETQLSTTHPGKVKYSKPEEKFVTGSKYEGYWNDLGYAGFGTYTFVHGAVYNGNFKNGEFHGLGTITYPSGVEVKGQWKNGKLISQKIVLDNGLEISAPWTYCEMPDRRFQIEHSLGFNGANEEYATNNQPVKDLPKNSYDAVDGYYEPHIKCIFKYPQPPRYSNASDTQLYKLERREIVRVPLKKEVERILQHHRRAEPMPTVGYRPDLYEEWVTGEMDLNQLTDNQDSYYSYQSEDSSNENIQLEVELLRTK